jgi:exodeoxyribonuclease VII small subunit
MSKTKTKEEELSLEEIIARLDGIVRSLESDQAPLEKSIRDFEEGIALSKRAQTMITAAEQRIEVMLGDEPAAMEADAE